MIGLCFSGLAALHSPVFDLLRFAGSAYVLWLAIGLLRAGGSAAPTQTKEATALDGALLLLFNPKAYLIIALMFTQFLPTTGPEDPALVVWITAFFTLNNLLAFTLWTVAGDLLTRRLRSTAGARLMNGMFGVILATVALWMLLR